MTERYGNENRPDPDARETRRVRVRVAGRVQGVCFRAETRGEAVRAGIRGWVRNLRDGRVEALFEGPAPLVEWMVDWCRKGPPFASVRSIEILEEPPGEALDGFEIRYGR